MYIYGCIVVVVVVVSAAATLAAADWCFVTQWPAAGNCTMSLPKHRSLTNEDYLYDLCIFVFLALDLEYQKTEVKTSHRRQRTDCS